ncbi:MAG: YraN family protein [Myxococcota bacterium]
MKLKADWTASTQEARGDVPKVRGGDRRQDVGQRGEALVAALYEERGYVILSRNWRTRTGELDLVVRNASVKRLVFVEVRTAQHSGGLVAPEQTVGWRKQTRVMAQAKLWLAEHPMYAQGWMVCFDVVGVVLATGEYVHMNSAFEEQG